MVKLVAQNLDCLCDLLEMYPSSIPFGDIADQIGEEAAVLLVNNGIAEPRNWSETVRYLCQGNVEWLPVLEERGQEILVFTPEGEWVWLSKLHQAGLSIAPLAFAKAMLALIDEQASTQTLEIIEGQLYDIGFQVIENVGRVKLMLLIGRSWQDSANKVYQEIDFRSGDQRAVVLTGLALKSLDVPNDLLKNLYSIRDCITDGQFDLSRLSHMIRWRLSEGKVSKGAEFSWDEEAGTLILNGDEHEYRQGARRRLVSMLVRAARSDDPWLLETKTLHQLGYRSSHLSNLFTGPYDSFRTVIERKGSPIKIRLNLKK